MYRDEEQIKHIYDNICSKCPYFKSYGEFGRCEINKKRLGDGLDNLNTIAKARYDCPHKPSKWPSLKIEYEEEIKEANKTKTPGAISATPISYADQKKGLTELAGQYLDERRKWVKAGKPMRPLPLINDIFKNQCSQCPHFKKKTPQAGSCSICGCRLHESSQTMNKIAWATTNCPDNPPRWTEETEPQNMEMQKSSGDKKRKSSGGKKRSCCGKQVIRSSKKEKTKAREERAEQKKKRKDS